MSETRRGLEKLEKAKEFWGQRKFKEAAEFYKQALAEDPDLLNHGISINLAHSLILSIDWKEVSKNLPPEINYLESSGWLKSLQTGLPVNYEFKPVPWYTYPAIEFLEDKLNKTLRVFEFGSGNSTLWWAERVLQVVAVENNLAWFSTNKEKILYNVELHFIEDEDDYAKKILDYSENSFDLIIIDGINRNKCAEYALKRLKDKGIIVFDNTEDEKYNEGILFLASKGFKRLDFYGLSPSYTYKNCTSIFFKDDNFLQRQKLPSEKQSCLGKSCFQVTNAQLTLAANKEQIEDKQSEKRKMENPIINNFLEEKNRIYLPPGDYVSPSFVIMIPDVCFPHLILGDKRYSTWRYSRKEIPHNRYVDKRVLGVGFLNRDEVHILYNTALKFRGKRALEVGCWLGWSACHLAMAGVDLDVIDPILERSDFYESVSSSLTAAGVMDSVNLIAGASPQKVEDLATQFNRQWSLIFIDGDHEAPGPLKDAIACEKFAAEDALVLFHDLASPDVAQGLEYFRQKGWNTMIYQTAQIMGVAWRGDVEPVKHQPDPKVQWSLPEHLHHYPVSGITTRFSENSEQPISLENEFSTIPVNLSAINLIVFPDWSQPEEELESELENIIRTILTHPERNQITLLIEVSNIAAEAVELALSGVIMKIFMEEELEENEEPNISLVGQLSDRQWSALLPQIRYRIGLERENKQMVGKAILLPSIQLDTLANQQLQISLSPSTEPYRNKIIQLVRDNPGQLSFEEYLYITERICEKGSGNFLIFGVGKDSELWIDINRGGKTVFLEDNPEWVNWGNKDSSEKEVYLVEYGTQRQEWLNLLVRYNQGEECLSLKLPDSILQTKWDFIFVDAPAGYSDEMPGRMKSIYTAAQLAFKSKNTEIFVHDCDRLVENIYTGYFFHKENFITQVRYLKHYKISL